MTEQKDIDDIKELDAISPDDAEIRNSYKQFPAETLDAFNKISNFARDVNISVAVPEIVVIGKKGSGKSFLIESIFGHPFFPANQTTTRRVLFINVVNNPECDDPRITIKRESSDYPVDVVVSIEDLPKVIEKRDAVQENSLAIQIKYESKHYGSFLLIDTPPLLLAQSTPESEVREKLVYELIKPPHRTIMVVEEANDWESMEMIEWTKKIDVKFSRTIFAFSKFHYHLQKFSNAREFNQYFSRRPADAKCFFWTGFSDAAKQKCLQSGDPKTEFQVKVWQAYERDMISLEELKFEKRFETSIGVPSVRNEILDLTWRSFKECLPELRKQLAFSKKSSSDTLRKIQDQLYGLDVSKLRSITSNYIADWLQIVVQLIDGSTEGNPSVTGQTLEEEDVGFGDWCDHNNRAISVDPNELNVKNFDIKLYGGQQFERMMNVFQAIIDQSGIFEVTMKDVDAAAVISMQRTSAYDYAWVASHIVQHYINLTFSALIDQLCHRGEYIMRRLADIAFNIVESRSNKKIGLVHGSRGAGSVIEDHLPSMRGYSYFQSTLKDIFNEHVGKTAENCKNKCLEEIQCTQLIYWELTGDQVSTPPDPKAVEVCKQFLLGMTTKLFEELRKNIVENVLLKCHNYFLVLMQRDLSGEILRDTSSFDDKLLEEMFELSTAKEKLKKDEERERTNERGHHEKETVLRDLSTQFSRLRLVAAAS